MTEVFLQMLDICKEFPGVRALDRVSFACNQGEVHALVGENGAGKSTLMKILAGAYAPDAGKILLNGEEVQFSDPMMAQTHGVSIIYQEFNLLPYLSVAENISLGHEPEGRFRLLDLDEQRQIARNALSINEPYSERFPKYAIRNGSLKSCGTSPPPIKEGASCSTNEFPGSPNSRRIPSLTQIATALWAHVLRNCRSTCERNASGTSGNSGHQS